LRDRIDDLRAQREARTPRRTPPSRIEAISRLPRIADYKLQFRGLGSAAMVSTRP
jgi:hypothetical protein